jgi:two-component system response regulator HydG
MKNPRKTILVIDDEKEFFNEFKEYISFADVEYAADLREAGSRLGRKGIDLVMVDLKLDKRQKKEKNNSIIEEDTGYKGLGYIKDLKLKHPNVPVIVISKYRDYDRVLLAGRYGADAYKWKAQIDYTDKDFRDEMIRLINEKRKRVKLDSAYKKEFWGESKAIIEIKSQIKSIADSQKAFVIVGETGLKHEALGRSIHRIGSRKSRDFVLLDLGQYSDGEILEVLKGKVPESHDANFLKPARKSMLFCPNVDRLSMNVQAAFVKLVKKGNYLDDNTSEKLDIQFGFSVSKSLDEILEKKSIEEGFLDFGTFSIVEIPPLRERKNDIKKITELYFEANGYDMRQLSRDQLKALMAYQYPYNTRELIHVLDTILENHFQKFGEERNEEGLLYLQESIGWDSFPVKVAKPGNTADSIDFDKEVAQKELEIIEKAFELNPGNKKEAAAMLNGRTPDHIRHIINKYKERFPLLIKQFPAISKAYKLDK